MNNLAVSHSFSGLLTAQEFAKLMKVSRTKVFDWKKRGVLLEGVDYFQEGRILRFCWREGHFLNSQQKSVSEDKGSPPPTLPPRSEEDSQRGEAPVNSPPLTFSRGSGPGVNLDY